MKPPCDCKPSIITRWQIANFINPLLQDVPSQGRGTSFQESLQRIPLSHALFGVAIAPSSPIDVCDVIYGDSTSQADRHRVSVRRPLLRYFAPGELSPATLSVVPVRAVSQLGTAPTAPAADGGQLQTPTLQLDLFWGAAPNDVPRERAPNVVYYTGAGSALAPINLPLNVCGRDQLVGWHYTVSNFGGGCTAVTPTLNKVTHVLDQSTGGVTTLTMSENLAGIASGVVGEWWDTPAGAAGGGVRNDGSCLFTYYGMTLTPDMGTFDYAVTGEAR